MQLTTPLAQALTGLNLPSYPDVTGLSQPITVHSLAAFAGSLAWACLLLISFTGWGRWVAKLSRVQQLPASVACVLGIAALIFLGGWLNLIHAIYPGVLITLAVMGLAFYFVLRNERPGAYRWRNVWNHSSLLAKLLFSLAVLILLMKVAATVRIGTMNTLDDIAAYMVFPHKMLAVHHFAVDPFSDRRVISSLGGSYFLQGLIIAATSLAHIGMADRTLGLILLGGILLDAGIEFNLSSLQIAIVGFLVYLVPTETINLTFIILPIAVLLAMAWLLWKAIQPDAERPWKYALLAGATGGAAIAMKSTYLPIVGAFLFLPIWMALGRRQSKTALRLFAVGLLGTVACLLAWMLAMKIASGTYLFPILGRGVDYSSYGIVAPGPTFYSMRSWLKIFLQGTVLLVLAGLQYLFAEKDLQSRFSIGILIAAAGAITAFNYKSGGDFIWRYNFAQFFCAVIIFYLISAGSKNVTLNRTPNKRLLYSVGMLAVFAMIFYYDAAGQDARPFRQVNMEWKDYRPSLHASLSGLQLASPQIQSRYKAIEESLPVGKTALENVAYPFLFHYANHNILVADWPGAASPAQAWPFNAGNSQLADFLTRNSVHYLIYDYGYAQWSDVEACTALENPQRNSRELSLLWWMSLLTHHQFERLRMTHNVDYDDGQIAVIDLDHLQDHGHLEETSWTLKTSTDQICSSVLAHYQIAP